jgi:hypothetical protein
VRSRVFPNVTVHAAMILVLAASLPRDALLSQGAGESLYAVLRKITRNSSILRCRDRLLATFLAVQSWERHSQQLCTPRTMAPGRDIPTAVRQSCCSSVLCRVLMINLRASELIRYPGQGKEDRSIQLFILLLILELRKKHL